MFQSDIFWNMLVLVVGHKVSSADNHSSYSLTNPVSFNYCLVPSLIVTANFDLVLVIIFWLKSSLSLIHNLGIWILSALVE